MGRVLAKFLLRILGWKVTGGKPNVTKYVMTVAPHTSNMDFFIAVLARKTSRMAAAKFAIKNTMLKPPFGWIIQKMGGIPVDRSKKNNFVDTMTEHFANNEEFALAIAPEGTRKYVSKWKTGFYYVALNSNVPIVMIGIDYKTKTLDISKPYFLIGDIKEDFKKLQDYYSKFQAKHPEKTFLTTSNSL